MKRTLIALLTCMTVFLTACSTTELKESLNDVADSITNGGETTATAEPTATPKPKDKVISIGKKGSVGDWKFTVKKCTIKKKIKSGSYRYFEASKGEKFVLFNISVRNNGKKAATFLPRFGYENEMVCATLYYKDKYEYKPTQLLAFDKDLLTDTIQPLTTEKGVIAFEVPNKVAKNKKNMKLRIGTAEDYVDYKLK